MAPPPSEGAAGGRPRGPTPGAGAAPPAGADLDAAAVEAWLRETEPARLDVLWRAADAARRRHVGDAVHLRGILEISNHCVRRCAYCGLRGPNASLARYRLDDEAVLTGAAAARALGCGTVVLQAGEDPGLDAARVAGIVARIKGETGLAVTLSLGEREEAELARWREAGADRYLLRFETSDPALYALIHPPRGGRRSDRVALLGTLRRLGYETGGGVMVGIPGQGYASLARDLLLFRTLDLDMVGLGPYLPNPAAPLGRGDLAPPAPPDGQAPATTLMTHKALALTRLLCPEANVPATTALAVLGHARGREDGLRRGANVLMPTLTPSPYRELYAIYPGKAAAPDGGAPTRAALAARLARLGRTMGAGPGGRRRAGA